MTLRFKRAAPPFWASALVGSLLSGAVACTNGLPPYGEVIVYVDTDLAVPAHAARLRVDTYGADGTWHESRDIARPDPASWPVSFSLFTRQEAHDTELLLRVRVYPEGKTREYAGEQYRPPLSYAEPLVASSLEELCALAPSIGAGDTVTLRRGDQARTAVLAQASSDCAQAESLRVTAAKVRIDEPGSYRFAITRDHFAERSALPSFPKLLLRRVCDDPSSQLACDQRQPLDSREALMDALPAFDAELDPGEYFLLQAADELDPLADFSVRVERTDLWNAAFVQVPHEPRVLQEGADVTPAVEPQPNLTVDRLVKVRLQPGIVRTVSVTLRGACIGVMARLTDSAPFQSPSPTGAASCIADPGTLLPVSEPDGGALTRTEQGSYSLFEACEGPTFGEALTCVPGGMFTLGDSMISGEVEPSNAVPERVARIHRFWLDRHEVTVGRFRNALERGMPAPQSMELTVNEFALATSAWQDDWRHCTWSSSERGREDYPINCIGWDAARRFCRFESGDLPTEAQWEYAGTAAAREFEARFVWGGDAQVEPTCDRAVFARSNAKITPKLMIELAENMPTIVSSECYEQAPSDAAEAPYGVLPVNARDGSRGDRTPTLELLGMAGNVSEWARDEAQPYAGPCWSRATLDEPACESTSAAPYRIFRGGSWQSAAAGLRAALRGAHTQTKPSGRLGTPYLGFRCAYADPPLVTP